jgi:hypothetical protein
MEKISDKSFWVGVFTVIILLALSVTHCHAQTKQPAKIDTIACNNTAIKKFVSKDNGKTVRIYAVYSDEKAGVSDIIPVSKSVYEYIETCRENGIKPSLGIRLRNGNISGIIKLKRIYEKR